MEAEQDLIDAFADVLAEHGENVTLHVSGGDEQITALLSLEAFSIGLEDSGPIGQTATLKIADGDIEHLGLDGTPTLTVTAREKVWHIVTVERYRVAYVQCGLRMKQDEFTHANIMDLNDEQATWVS